MNSIKQTILKLVPRAEESISYAMPTYKYNGLLAHFAAYENHIGFYPGSLAIEVFADDIAGFKNAKGSVQFPLNKPMPLGLVARIVAFRLNENSNTKKINIKIMASNNKTTINAEPGKQEIVITREFDAPRELVFKAFTDPELMPRWLGPRELTMKIDQWDARSGGHYRYIHTDSKGNAYGFHGMIHEVLAPERIIQTFEFEGLPESGHVALETARLEALPGGRTRLVIQSVFQSVGDRDGMLQSDMERGVNDSHQRLDELFAGLSQ